MKTFREALIELYEMADPVIPAHEEVDPEAMMMRRKRAPREPFKSGRVVDRGSADPDVKRKAELTLNRAVSDIGFDNQQKINKVLAGGDAPAEFNGFLLYGGQLKTTKKGDTVHIEVKSLRVLAKTRLIGSGMVSKEKAETFASVVARLFNQTLSRKLSKYRRVVGANLKVKNRQQAVNRRGEVEVLLTLQSSMRM